MSGQRTLSLEMREFDPTDYQRLLEIYNANYPEYTRSINEWRSRDESVDRSKYHLQRYAFLENNAVVGFGDVSHVTTCFIHGNSGLTSLSIHLYGEEELGAQSMRS